MTFSRHNSRPRNLLRHPGYILGCKDSQHKSKELNSFLLRSEKNTNFVKI